jgi:hypothetical protein
MITDIEADKILTFTEEGDLEVKSEFEHRFSLLPLEAWDIDLDLYLGSFKYVYIIEDRVFKNSLYEVHVHVYNNGNTKVFEKKYLTPITRKSHVENLVKLCELSIEKYKQKIELFKSYLE